MLFDLVELTESMTLPPMDEKAAEKLLNLKQITADIIGCSLASHSSITIPMDSLTLH